MQLWWPLFVGVSEAGVAFKAADFLGVTVQSSGACELQLIWCPMKLVYPLPAPGLLWAQGSMAWKGGRSPWQTLRRVLREQPGAVCSRKAPAAVRLVEVDTRMHLA